jgi:hypothetical protein
MAYKSETAPDDVEDGFLGLGLVLGSPSHGRS